MLKGFADKFLDMTKRVLTGPSPYEIQEVTVSQLSKYTVVIKENGFTLYKDKNLFTAIVQLPNVPNTGFSIFRTASESEAQLLFDNMSFKIQAFCKTTVELWNKDKLQQLSDIIREHPGWGCAHICAKLGLIRCLSNELIATSLNDIDNETGVSPIHVAIETGNIDVVKELIIKKVRLSPSADKQKHNVFHYAARTNNETIIQFLASKDRSDINELNSFGESALHEACLGDRPKNVEQLLRWGSDPMLTMSDRLPIHCAVQVNSVQCLNALCRWSKDLLHLEEKRFGGTPLHCCKSRECIYALCDLGCNREAINKEGETALMVMVRSNLIDCTMGLLAKAANADVKDINGNGPIHTAIEMDNADMVQLLIVFGSDINASNNADVTPRHKAAISNSSNKDFILYFLNGVGAMRCPPNKSGCGPGCAFNGNVNGLPRSTPVSTPEHQKKIYDSVFHDVAMAAAMTRSASANESAILIGSGTNSISLGGDSAGDRVLCLDGGGIRGLVLIQLLLAIEAVVGQPIRNCFDWIGGTSTGGILALALLHGKTVRYCQGLYFQLKDAVFEGRRPYDSAPLEEFLKKEFGETTRMSERDYPRVMVTGVLADRMPAELHLFRNYDVPGQDNDAKSKTPSFAPLQRPNDQLVWRAARCSGAAPTYFRACGRFLDGGLIANNPTLDVITEIHQYNMALKVKGQSQLSRPIHVVVSLGTGRLPVRPINACDVFRPEGLFDLAKAAFGAKNLGELLVDQATQSEGRVVERAMAWCSMIGVPYYRFSPQLSEDISLDCKDDKALINMLWETQCYIQHQQEKLQQLAALLWS